MTCEATHPESGQTCEETGEHDMHLVTVRVGLTRTQTMWENESFVPPPAPPPKMTKKEQQDHLNALAQAVRAREAEEQRQRLEAIVTGLPVLPYAGTSGWSGSVTSQERAQDEDARGTTQRRQEMLLRMLHSTSETGMTVAEAREALGEHHGKVSGALSVLHGEGLIRRLTERRDRCQVYVLPQYVAGRELALHKSEQEEVLAETLSNS